MSRIVFPWQRESSNYNTMEFNPVSTEGRMSMMDVERVLQQICSLDCVKKTPNGGFCALFMIIWILACVLIYVNILDGANGDAIFIVIFGFICFVIGGTSGSIYYMMNKMKKLYLQRQTQIQAILNRENQTYFQGREIRWLVGTHGAWIQVELDYMARKMNAGLNLP